MLDLAFSNLIDLHISSILEDVFVLLMLYIFIKLLLLGSLVELIWPTHFFNKRNSMVLTSFKFRSFIELVVKLRTTFTLTTIFAI